MKRKRKTTKNTVAKPPVTRLCVIEGDCNGPFKIITDFTTEKEQEEFERLYVEWFNSPLTKVWCIESFIIYFKEKHPKRMCLLYAHYEQLVAGKVIPATKEEWESENN